MVRLCVGRGKWVHSPKCPTFWWRKIQFNEAPGEYKYTKETSLHALWLLICDYKLFQLVPFENPIESNCLHWSPLRFEELQYLTLEIIMLK